MAVRIGKAAVAALDAPSAQISLGRFVGDGRGQPTSSLLDVQGGQIAGLSLVWRLQIATLAEAFCYACAARLTYLDSPAMYAVRARNRQIGIVFLAGDMGFTTSEIARLIGVNRRRVQQLLDGGQRHIDHNVCPNSLAMIEGELATLRTRFLAIGAAS
jgi:hypothetical protein